MKKRRRIDSLSALRDIFENTLLGARWVLCVDSGGCFLRYCGPACDEVTAEAPIQLNLPTSPWELLVEALLLAGIPAERA